MPNILHTHLPHFKLFLHFFCMFNSVQYPSPDFSSTVYHPWTCLLHSSITYESFQRNFLKIVVYFITLYTGIIFTFEEQLARTWKSWVLVFSLQPLGILSPHDLVFGFERSTGLSCLLLLVCLKHYLCLEFASVIRLLCVCVYVCCFCYSFGWNMTSLSISKHRFLEAG